MALLTARSPKVTPTPPEGDLFTQEVPFIFFSPVEKMVRWAVAVDFQIAFPQETVKVSLVRPVPGLAVRTLEITGEDFRSVDEVLMNEVPSPSFVVLTKNRLVAEVPDPLKSSTISSISVLSKRLTITPRSYMRFRIGRVPSKTRGILRLLQVYLRLLFQTPGTDIFAPNLGGGALVHIGQSVSVENGTDLVGDFIVSVDNTTRQIIQIQARNQSIPPDERLLTAKVIAAGFNKNETAILASIEVVSQAGRSAVARLEV